MTLHTLLLIIVVLFSVAIFIGIIIFTFLLGKHTVKNNPRKAYILIKQGNNIDRIYKGKLDEVCKKGISYRYDDNKTVMIPNKYQEVYLRNKRLICLNHTGQLIALPFGKDVSLDNEESKNLIYELCASHIGADGMRALKGKSTMQVVVVAIIAFIIGAGLVFGFTQFQKTTAQKQTIQQQQTIPSQKPIEVK